ncbi:MAG: hypothetical protein WBP12_03030 [Candidatus Saccharimonas sp.]
MTALNSVGQRLLTSLAMVKQRETTDVRKNDRIEKVNVVGAGGTLTAAYEQLRNAAENAEEHLLLQNAVRRFYKRLFVTRDEVQIRTSGNELAVELTFAGYVPNNSLTRAQIEEISRLAMQHYAAYEVFHQDRSVSMDAATKWLLDTLSVRVVNAVDDRERAKVFVEVAYAYFDSTIPEQLKATKYKATTEYQAPLLAVIHKALLKSDTATIRTALLEQYGVTVAHQELYVTYNNRIDTMLKDPLTDAIFHMVDRQGAPLRVLKRMIDSRPDFLDLLSRREVFLEAYEQQVNKEYSTIMARVNRAIVRSVMFLVITKFIVGIAIEVPYDLWAYGMIHWQPLMINLLFPPLYMVALRLTLNAPGYANTTALVDHVDTMLYGDRPQLRKRAGNRQYSSIFSVLYALFGLTVFGGVMWLLLMLGFSLVHIGIFFVFISAASFLGFRISRLIRELEIVRSASNGLTFVRDFVYLPFVVVGRWMSDQYSQINVVTLILDMLIELPLKTVLRLVRQWGAFIDDRKDRI